MSKAEVSQAYLISLFKKQVPQEEIVQILKSKGIDENDSKKLVLEVYELHKLNQIEQRKQEKKAGEWDLKLGLILTLTGASCSIVTYFLTNGQGFFLFYGLIIGGIVYLAKYLINK